MCALFHTTAVQKVQQDDFDFYVSVSFFRFLLPPPWVCDLWMGVCVFFLTLFFFAVLRIFCVFGSIVICVLCCFCFFCRWFVFGYFGLAFFSLSLCFVFCVLFLSFSAFFFLSCSLLLFGVLFVCFSTGSPSRFPRFPDKVIAGGACAPRSEVILKQKIKVRLA